VQFASAHLKKSRLLDVTVLGLHLDRTDEIAKKQKREQPQVVCPSSNATLNTCILNTNSTKQAFLRVSYKVPKHIYLTTLAIFLKKNKVSSVLTRILKCTMAGGTKAHGKVPIGITRHLSLLTMICLTYGFD
jgi:hypothetical protein